MTKGFVIMNAGGPRPAKTVDDYPSLDGVQVEDWNRETDYEVLKSALRLAPGTTLLRYVPIDEAHGALIWQYANKASLVKPVEAKNLVVEFTLDSLIFPIEQRAGKEIRAFVTTDEQAKLSEHFARKSREREL